eukprot:TRINITY_DN4266_c0_g1_i2.p1 TRINITY_DN4266_c0_g1~~TRINITY_DN4266_c0_g1_i2.p1  ORF type:complete len:669 (-),score=173.24 TRINITY_DN4266_c0_g1_i2:127-2133(-)
MNRSGPLIKLGYKSGKWQNRWIVLSGSTITYFLGQYSVMSQGSFSVAGCRVEVLEEGSPFTNEMTIALGIPQTIQVPFCFKIEAWKRTYVFAASSETERDAWVADLSSRVGAPPLRSLTRDRESTRGLRGDMAGLSLGPASPNTITPPPSQIPSAWKTRIAHEKRNAVVKIHCQVVPFDWEYPYRRADDLQGVGSGFFVTNDGLIVTNAHVVEEAAKIWITVPANGETQYPAEVLGVCFDNDLAVLRSKTAPVLGIMEIGNSNEVQYGQEVLTLGYPLGMNSLKLTEGIISGRQNSLFQIDAPLNPGNSGGPLINDEGKVIGINVSIVQQSQNIGFAIPSFYLQQLFPALTSRPPNKRVVRKPTLGAEFSNSSETIQQYIGCDPKVTGLFVRETFEGFPLYNAGVRGWDLLLKFNGFELDNFGDAHVPWSPYAKVSLGSLVSLLTAESTPEIEYFSNADKKIHKATLILEDAQNKGYPILPRVTDHYPPYEKLDYEVIGGLVVMELTSNHISYFLQAVNDAVVRFLAPITVDFAKRAKPQLIICSLLIGSAVHVLETFIPGTILSTVNGVNVGTLEEFRAAISKPVLKDGKYFITFQSEQNEFIAIAVNDAIAEEFDLAKNNSYNPSIIIKDWVDNEDFMSKVCQSKDEYELFKQLVVDFFDTRGRRV